MTDAELIERLYEWGHFRNPAYPDTHDVSQADLPNLTLEDNVVQDAVRSYQDFFAPDVDSLALALHGRRMIVDGGVGPATRSVALRPRCGVPEYGSEPQQANWPDECRREITVSYNLTALNLPASAVRVEWQRALESWERLIGVRFQLLDDFSTRSRIWARARALPGSTLAWSYLAQDSCAASLEQAYDQTTIWSSGFLQATICHEVGHALGAQHSRSQRAIMYPSITDVVIPSSDDVAAMRSLGYGEPFQPDEPDTPDIPGDIPPGRGKFVTHDGKRYNLIGILEA